MPKGVAVNPWFLTLPHLSAPYCSPKWLLLPHRKCLRLTVLWGGRLSILPLQSFTIPHFFKKGALVSKYGTTDYLNAFACNTQLTELALESFPKKRRPRAQRHESKPKDRLLFWGTISTTNTTLFPPLEQGSPTFLDCKDISGILRRKFLWAPATKWLPGWRGITKNGCRGVT